MRLKQPHCFDIKRNGEPIEFHHIRHGVNPGISLGKVLPNLVSLYEEQEALRYANYNYQEWLKLSPEEKALHVAHYRYTKIIKLNVDDAVNSRMEAEARKAKRGR